jgi:hypothetical protein
MSLGSPLATTSRRVQWLGVCGDRFLDQGRAEKSRLGGRPLEPAVLEGRRQRPGRRHTGSGEGGCGWRVRAPRPNRPRPRLGQGIAAGTGGNCDNWQALAGCRAVAARRGKSDFIAACHSPAGQRRQGSSWFTGCANKIWAAPGDTESRCHRGSRNLRRAGRAFVRSCGDQRRG